MPSALDTTIGGATANSYGTLAEANAYFGDRPRSGVWEDADPEDQLKALIQAARLLDTRVVWKGTGVNYNQAMAWPRHMVRDPIINDGSYIPHDQIPRWLKEAQFEQAIAILAEDMLSNSAGTGVSALSVGAVSITFDRRGNTPEVLSGVVREMITPYGRVASASSSGPVPVVRT